MDLGNHFFAGMQRCYKHEQIGHIFHKLLDAIEERLTWCFKFIQGIWDGIQTGNGECSISSAGNELQREKGENAHSGRLERRRKYSKVD